MHQGEKSFNKTRTLFQTLSWAINIKAPSRPRYTCNKSTTNIRTTGRDSSSRPLSSLTWFSFLYSNLLQGGLTLSAERQLSVNSQRVSLLCWQAGRRGQCLSVTGFCSTASTCWWKCSLARCRLLSFGFGFKLCVSIWSLLTPAAIAPLSIGVVTSSLCFCVHETHVHMVVLKHAFVLFE